ncbi:hypothetical protein AB0L40_26375 [Patulibacter sp. NPDC049589]|uniref:hypothetical protein n=1 Tax=Patulibacter sp. NPDC049589 TaxID=3154731 RepID=UPI00342C6F23
MSTPYRQPLRPGATSWERWLADVANHGPDPVADPGPGPSAVPRASSGWRVLHAWLVAALLCFVAGADDSTVVSGLFVVAVPVDGILRAVRTRLDARSRLRGPAPPPGR